MESPGAKLKKIRLARGISLEEVQKKTKIHLNILKAIEGDGLTNLSPIYLKGFLKIYCKFLGLSPQEYLIDYKEQDAAEPKIITKSTSGKPIKSAPFFKVRALRLPSFKGININKKVRTASVFILILAILAIGLFKLGKSISSRRSMRPAQARTLPSKPQKKATKKAQSATKIAPKPAGQQAAAAKLAPLATPVKKETTSGIVLGIRTKENCWVSIKVDGRLVFQRVLEKGRFESWQAKDKIELSLGNAAAVELEVNGQLFSSLGRKGQRRNNIVITKEGLNITR